MSKLLVAIAVLAAAGYAFHRLRTCQVVFAPQVAASNDESIPSKAAPQGDVIARSAAKALLLYPSQMIEQSFKLGYDTFKAEGGDGWQAVPLPPGVALQVLVAISVEGQRALNLTLPDERCKAGVEVTAWRSDQDEPILHTLLKNGNQSVDVPAAIGTASLVVGLRLPEGAANNWFCNVHASWRKAS